MMARHPRDRDADRTAIRAAADRLLAGTPLRSASGKLTVTELITESGLRRDVAYSHRDLIDGFRARLRAQDSTPAAFQHLADQKAELTDALADVRKRLAAEQATTAILRKALAELSLELQEAQEELTALGNVTRLPAEGAPRRAHGHSSRAAARDKEAPDGH
jgi:hypothetical protein